MTASLRADRAVQWLALHRERLRSAGLAASVVLFAAGLFLALRSTPGLAERLAAGPLAVLFLVGVPLQQGLNAAEFRLLTRLGGGSVGWPAAFEVAVYTSAANLLPLPGGVITRIAAMRGLGIGVGRGSLVTLIGLGLWGGVAFVFSGAWLLLGGERGAGALFLVVGGALLGPALAGCLRMSCDARLMAWLLLLRLGSIALEALRMALAIRALGEAIAFEEASIFAVASFLGTVVSIAPAGLGVREVVVAGLSPFVGIDPAVGFLAATVNRAVGMAGLAVTASVLLRIQGRRRA
jgi:uncharacterized membrane protein YbhN (UPF0104 family)